MGGLYGRVVGLLMTRMFGVHSEDFGYWAWMDPGVFSLIGAASFFGGVTRLALAVTVIMVNLREREREREKERERERERETLA